MWDKLADLLDTITRLEDPIDRLAALTYAARISRERIESDRDRAAFEARLENTLDTVSDAIGVHREQIRSWTSAYRNRTGDDRPFVTTPARVTDWSEAVVIPVPLLD